MWTETYLLADKYCIVELKNKIVDAFRLYSSAAYATALNSLSNLQRRGAPGNKLLLFSVKQRTFNTLTNPAIGDLIPFDEMAHSSLEKCLEIQTASSSSDFCKNLQNSTTKSTTIQVRGGAAISMTIVIARNAI